ncbi:MAG TPA: hypothetical protein VKP30_10630 [Polyangiaceae bacterium]|nr:hypothetical protein [Polyangiaceae bacterium]
MPPPASLAPAAQRSACLPPILASLRMGEYVAVQNVHTYLLPNPGADFGVTRNAGDDSRTSIGGPAGNAWRMAVRRLARQGNPHYP